MRGLYRAAKQGPHAFFISLADFPHRNPFLISGVAGSLVIVLLIFVPGGLLSQQEEIQVQRTEITKISALCGSSVLHGDADQASLCAERMRIALLNCRRDEKCSVVLERTIRSRRDRGAQCSRSERVSGLCSD